MNVKLKISINDNESRFEEQIRGIINRAIARTSALNKAQLGYIANSFTNAFHEYIENMGRYYGRKKMFMATYNLITKGSKVTFEMEQRNPNMLTYRFGLKMELYGYYLGGTDISVQYSKKAAHRLSKWISAKMMRGITFYTYRKTKSGKIIKKPIASDKDRLKVAYAILGSGEIETKKDWYVKALRLSGNFETGNPFLVNSLNRLISTGNLQTAIANNLKKELE